MSIPPLLSASAPSPVVSSRPLKVGLIMPIFEGWFAGSTARWSDLAAFARVAEDIGFDSLWIPDHLLFGDDAGRTWGIWEGWSLLTALAAITHRVEIGSFVTCSGFRNPALLAKMADTVEEISGGRLILGLGAGYHEQEYRAFGYPYDHRTDRFTEALHIIAGLLRNGCVDFSGTFYEARDCELRPRGPRPQGPPIMIGASEAGPRMLDLTVRYGNGWNVWLDNIANTASELGPLMTRVDVACTTAARDPASLERSAAVFVAIGPHAPSMMTAEPLTGSVEAIATGLRAYADAGISHLQVWLEPNTSAGIEAFAPVLERLDRG